MRALLFCGLLLALPLGAAPVRGPKTLPSGPNVKVLLEKDANSALLEVKGAYRVVRTDTGSTLSSGSFGKRYVVHALQDGIRWGEEYPDVFQISIIPKHADTLVYVDGIQYKGSVSIYHVRNNLVTIVNEVAIEDFVKSTLALQFDTPMHTEALRALAIAARTEAYTSFQNGQSTSRPWDINAQDAGYFGCGVTQQRNGVEEAVDWTRFMVLESLQGIRLFHTEAERLAHRGCDAKKILESAFPKQKLGITINPDQVALR